MIAVTPFAPDRWYSAQQVQETLSLSRSTVERLGVEGKVAAIKIGRSAATTSTASARASAPASAKRRAPSGRSAGSGQNP